MSQLPPFFCCGLYTRGLIEKNPKDFFGVYRYFAAGSDAEYWHDSLGGKRSWFLVGVWRVYFFFYHAPNPAPWFAADGCVLCIRRGWWGQRVVRRRTRSQVTRRSTQATQARVVPGAFVGCSASKTALKASQKIRNRHEEYLGRTVVDDRRECGSVVNRHDSSYHVPRHGLVVLACHFRDGAGLPEKNATCGIA